MRPEYVDIRIIIVIYINYYNDYCKIPIFSHGLFFIQTRGAYYWSEL